MDVGECAGWFVVHCVDVHEYAGWFAAQWFEYIFPGRTSVGTFLTLLLTAWMWVNKQADLLLTDWICRLIWIYLSWAYMSSTYKTLMRVWQLTVSWWISSWEGAVMIALGELGTGELSTSKLDRSFNILCSTGNK